MSRNPQFTEQQGQYLAFIHAYTLLNKRPPAEADPLPDPHSRVEGLSRVGRPAPPAEATRPSPHPWPEVSSSEASPSILPIGIPVEVGVFVEERVGKEPREKQNHEGQAQEHSHRNRQGDKAESSLNRAGTPPTLDLELEDSAELILGRAGKVQVRYQNGPIMSAGTASDLPDYTPLAWFRSEVVRYEPQKGTMINTPAIVCADFGEGRVLCISPHPEATPGLESIIASGIRWAAQNN